MDKAKLKRLEALAQQPHDAQAMAFAVALAGTVDASGWTGAGMVIPRLEGEDDEALRLRVASRMRGTAAELMVKLADMLPD
jgi:hypothetical protein